MNDGSVHSMEYFLRCSDESVFVIVEKIVNDQAIIKNRLHLTKWNSVISLQRYPTEKFKTLFGMRSESNHTVLFIDTENSYETPSRKRRHRIFSHIFKMNITKICSLRSFCDQNTSNETTDGPELTDVFRLDKYTYEKLKGEYSSKYVKLCFGALIFIIVIPASFISCFIFWEKRRRDEKSKYVTTDLPEYRYSRKSSGSSDPPVYDFLEDLSALTTST
ncbi:hypothetical protein RF11_07938 [Thelohanellus kitauei]|uniref:Uncharacterized protein n=1 Tax=Thelohanellus kitauei TaxID=669202 RepID=A0A0C2IZ24_THEKT|nr:hypothetical protein RF11_07938 [Thelohanellus kitauei]